MQRMCSMGTVVLALHASESAYVELGYMGLDCIYMRATIKIFLLAVKKNGLQLRHRRRYRYREEAWIRAQIIFT
jgi:hypothetical protein